MIVGSRLQQSDTNAVDVGDRFVIADDIIKRPCHTLIGIIDNLVATCAVNTLSGIGCTKTEVLEFRSELDTIVQALQRRPDLSEVNLCIGTTVDTEVLSLVLGIVQLVNGVLDIHITCRILDEIAIRIVRHRPRQHTTQGVVVVTCTSGRLREAITILLRTIRSIHRHTHGEVRQDLSLERGVECEALVALTRCYTLLVQITK